MAEGIFLPDGPRFVATELARGPWDAAAQHGGAPAALILRAFEGLPAADGLLLARVTYEFLRPVPLAALEVRAEVARAGRRVALLEGSVLDGDGKELVRARALMVRRAEGALRFRSAGSGTSRAGSRPSAGTAPPGPESAAASDFPGAAKRPMFATDAMEIRFTAGDFTELGPAGAWFRLRVPLVAGDAASPLQRLAAAADFGNGISSIVPWEDHLFINPDLTLYVERQPTGEWIHLDARTRIAPEGVAIAAGALSDERGPVGLAIQALLVQRTR